jgi:hypothetical protein
MGHLLSFTSSTLKNNEHHEAFSALNLILNKNVISQKPITVSCVPALNYFLFFLSLFPHRILLLFIEISTVSVKL